MSDKSKFLNELDIAVAELDFGVSSLALAHAAMSEGNIASDTAEESIYCTQLYMEDRCRKLRELLESAYERRLAV